MEGEHTVLVEMFVVVLTMAAFTLLTVLITVIVESVTARVSRKSRIATAKEHRELVLQAHRLMSLIYCKVRSPTESLTLTEHIYHVIADYTYDRCSLCFDMHPDFEDSCDKLMLLMQVTMAVNYQSWKRKQLYHGLREEFTKFEDICHEILKELDELER